MKIALALPAEPAFSLPAEAVRRMMVYCCATALICAGLIAAPQASANAMCLANTAFARTI